MESETHNLNEAFAARLNSGGIDQGPCLEFGFQPRLLAVYVRVCDNNQTVNKLVQIFPAIFPRKKDSYAHCAVAREWIILHDSDNYNMG